MKKIIFLFLMFSAMLFAKWEVGTAYTKNGEPLTTFTTYDLGDSGAYILIGVNVDSLGYSVIAIFHGDIQKGDNLILVITDNEGNDINSTFHSDDFKSDDMGCYGINVPSNRASVLTKMLYNGKSAKLMKNFEPIATFDLSGIKKVMQKHVGNSYWYKYKLND
ncbi:hypothetical protein EPJ79_02240 [Brachyspira aalborgi]|uniref:Uncharacterized protein n=1 Tax=Brachyspira aalborgi TaxID=29522 RepID=A0A5C8D3H1_9SPIR|nr:hypothetical protein [Brachyspira aalborgi]TXJ20000.1 hypothetical protein EPJ79_02240 [Brachyspira aalborgi]